MISNWDNSLTNEDMDMQYFNKQIFVKQVKKDYLNLKNKIYDEKNILLKKINLMDRIPKEGMVQKRMLQVADELRKGFEKMGVDVASIEKKANHGLRLVQEATKKRLNSDAGNRRPRTRTAKPRQNKKRSTYAEKTA